MNEQKRKQQMITFRKNGKVYPHYRHHKANERQVKFDEWHKHFQKRKGRFMTIEEAEVFKQAFNIGWKLAKEHSEIAFKTQIQDNCKGGEYNAK